MSWNVTALCTCSSCLPNNFVWRHTSLDPDSLSRKLKSQSEVVFCLANGLCGLFCALVISDSAPHEIFLEKESGWRDYLSTSDSFFFFGLFILLDKNFIFFLLY